MDKQTENLSTIKFCIVQIKKYMSKADSEDRWLWEVRYKVAQFIYFDLLRHQNVTEVENYTLSDQQKQEIIQTHPLLEPFTQATIGVTSEQKKKIQKEIYDRIHRMYYFSDKNDSEK